MASLTLYPDVEVASLTFANASVDPYWAYGDEGLYLEDGDILTTLRIDMRGIDPENITAAVIKFTYVSRILTGAANTVMKVKGTWVERPLSTTWNDLRIGAEDAPYDWYYSDTTLGPSFPVSDFTLDTSNHGTTSGDKILKFFTDYIPTERPRPDFINLYILPVPVLDGGGYPEHGYEFEDVVVELTVLQDVELDGTLDDITLTSTGGWIITGQVQKIIDPVTLSAPGTTLIQAELDVTLEDILLDAVSIHTDGSLITIIDDITLSSRGTTQVKGTAPALDLDDITLSATGVHILSASLTVSLDDIILLAISGPSPPVKDQLNVFLDIGNDETFFLEDSEDVPTVFR